MASTNPIIRFLTPVPSPLWAASPIPVLPLLVLRWFSVTALNVIAFERNVFEVPLYPRALIATACVALEFLGYIYPYYKGTLKPSTLLNSSVVYLLLMMAVPVVIGIREGIWKWFGGGAGSIACFVLVNAILATVSAGVAKRGEKPSGDEEKAERTEKC
ncbi:hypothetical protein BDD12DRAFT_877156 [Trichophaea hybrida]|nr:hypothetical protein BDD12DRAFT_877156 [Trichophaea hybrida]